MSRKETALHNAGLLRDSECVPPKPSALRTGEPRLQMMLTLRRVGDVKVVRDGVRGVRGDRGFELFVFGLGTFISPIILNK